MFGVVFAKLTHAVCLSLCMHLNFLLILDWTRLTHWLVGLKHVKCELGILGPELHSVSQLGILRRLWRMKKLHVYKFQWTFLSYNILSAYTSWRSIRSPHFYSEWVTTQHRSTLLFVTAGVASHLLLSVVYICYGNILVLLSLKTISLLSFDKGIIERSSSLIRITRTTTQHKGSWKQKSSKPKLPLTILKTCIL